MEKSELMIKFEEKFKKIFPGSIKPVNKEISELHVPVYKDEKFGIWRKNK